MASLIPAALYIAPGSEYSSTTVTRLPGNCWAGRGMLRRVDERGAMERLAVLLTLAVIFVLLMRTCKRNEASQPHTKKSQNFDKRTVIRKE